MIPEPTIANIRERVDIAAFVGEYVRLKKSGASFKGLCPFHNEKTPSFYVHPQRRFFHCFGCGASGDIFSFLMRIEGLTFPEAARRLAEKAGVELPRDDPEKDAAYNRQRQREERMAALVEAAAGYYIQQLEEHPLGPMARKVIEERAITPETARAFRLGYAPHGWDHLVEFLRKGGWSPADAETVGLIVPRRGDRGGHYDRFRHRLMFPIADHRGRIVAFSGRALDAPEGTKEPDEPPAKYVNSPEGPLYHKGEILFGLYEGRVQVRRTGWVALCEGNFDLLALHQAGIANAVAPMGTALTDAQCKLLKRYAEKAVLLFDGDKAGKRAVRSAYAVLAKAGIDATVVTLPPGSDPDMYLRTEGAEALQRRIDQAPGIVEHLIDDAAASVSSASEKAQKIADLGPVLIKVDNPVEVRLYVERVAQKFGVSDVDAVRRQLRKGVRRGRKRRDEPQENPVKSEVKRPRRKPVLPRIEVGVMGALLDCPGILDTSAAKKFEELLTSPDLRAILQATSRWVEEREGGSRVVNAPALLAEVAGNPALPWLEDRLAKQEYEDERGALEQLEAALPLMQRAQLKQRLAELSRAILEAQRTGNDDLARELRHEHLALLQSARQKKASDSGSG